MSTASDSSMDFHLEPMPFAPARSESALTGEGGIWLDGEVLACICPDCGAPMSIRLWLMTADCFRCGGSLELTEEQEQEALRLLREQEEARQAESAAATAAAAAILPTMVRRPKRQRTEPQITQAPPAPAIPAQPRAVPAEQPETETEERPEPRRRRAASSVHRGARGRIRRLYERGGFVVWWSELTRDMPAWFISAVVHAVALLLLALWLDSSRNEKPSVTLSTSVSHEDTLGDQGKIEDSDPDAVEFETPGALPLENALEDMGMIDEPVAPEDVDPTEIMPPADPPGILPHKPFEQQLPRDLTQETGKMFPGRNPEVRAQKVLAEGGTTQTEAAVARALEWLQRHQNEDGSWSLDAFHKAPGARGKKPSDVGTIHSDMAGTALALLPFLGAGQTHLEGEYQDTVRKGLEWIATNQLENGDCRGEGDGRMYAHGQASIALCEAYAMTQDEQLREFAQMALNFTVKAQHSQGGWRYAPGESADTSVVGWQVMALKSGSDSLLHVPEKTYDMTSLYLDRAKADKLGGRYRYRPGGHENEAMTAEGLLCRMYLGWPRDHPGIQEGVNYLVRNHLPDADKQNMYYWYYATQVMHHYQGKPWETWNAKMSDVLVKTQEKAGDHAGSWAATGGQHDKRAGRLYMTSLAACILEVYYRHMPIYGTEIGGKVRPEPEPPKSKDDEDDIRGLLELHVRPNEREPRRRRKN